jgi:hypothetical protein
MTSTRRAAITIAALVALSALLVRRASRPPEPVPALAASTEFSAERALTHVREIAQRPHPAGSPDNDRVRAYLLAQLRALGLEPQVQEATGVGTRYATAGRVKNVLARLPGRTPGGLAVVLMAHYDGVAGGPAAGDDAAGTAAILETLRALRAGPPLAHDVIALVTDGEEAGLLGAAAFVREHAWAKDVGVTLNFEARGTTGRSYMFETGPGNLDVARVLRTAGDVSATSLSVAVYRTLPNDTDLSEMALLGKPALNFAFADGIERYHTAHDDVAHLDAGSLQHHGGQMLALARALGNGPLPRPTTGDAVFFDLPIVGLVVYREGWVWPIALVAVVLVGLLMLPTRDRWARDVGLGVLGTVVSTALGIGVAMLAGNLIARLHDARAWGGAPAFRGVYTAALAMAAIAVSLACWAIVRRWASVAGAHLGALIVWTLITVLVTWKLPGVSFMFVWPLIAAAIAAAFAVDSRAGEPQRLTPKVRAELWRWMATALTLAVIVPIVYAVSAVMLGAVGPGGIATGALVSLTAWLLAPQLEAIGAGRRWLAAGAAAGCTVALMVTGMMTVRSSAEHPASSQIAYGTDADSANAWLAVRGPMARQLVTSRESASSVPSWLRVFGTGRTVAYLRAPRLQTDGPTAAVIADSTVAGERHVTLRVRAPSGTETIGMRANDTRVLRAAIDGRAIDPSRYRASVRIWRLDYTAPPDSGVTLALTVPTGSGVSLDLIARARGVPSLPDVRLPPRAADVVTAHSGDVTVVHRTVRIQ